MAEHMGGYIRLDLVQPNIALPLSHGLQRAPHGATLRVTSGLPISPHEIPRISGDDEGRFLISLLVGLTCLSDPLA